jgi:hypothetical protein
VRILAPYTEVAPRISTLAGRLEPDGEDACVLRSGTDNLQWIAMHLAALGRPVEVIDPPELLAEIEALGRWAASARPAE